MDYNNPLSPKNRPYHARNGSETLSKEKSSKKTPDWSVNKSVEMMKMSDPEDKSIDKTNCYLPEEVSVAAEESLQMAPSTIKSQKKFADIDQSMNYLPMNQDESFGAAKSFNGLNALKASLSSVSEESRSRTKTNDEIATPTLN
jgi:hypothetical protein